MSTSRQVTDIAVCEAVCEAQQCQDRKTRAKFTEEQYVPNVWLTQLTLIHFHSNCLENLSG